MDQTLSDVARSAGLLLLRLGAGGLMATHGWGKVLMVLAADFDRFADPIGIGMAPSLILAALAEFVGSNLVALGLVTRLAALSVAFTMAVAAFVVHRNDPWLMQHAAEAFRAGTSQTWSSKEPALLFLIPFLALVLTGPGRFSLDHWLLGRRGRRAPAPA